MQNNSSSLNKSRRFFNYNGKGLKNALVIDDQKIDCFIAEKFILQYDPHASVQSFNTVSSALRHLRKLEESGFSRSHCAGYEVAHIQRQLFYLGTSETQAV